MKYSILGFNQEKIVNYQVKDETGKILTCDLEDLLIMNYIIYANSNPKMNHYMDVEKKPCVWIIHSHLLEDLPILDITEGTLKNRLTKLRKMNLITSITVANERLQGCRTYYRTTSFLNDMIFESTSQKNDEVKEARHKKMTPDKQLDYNNRSKQSISKDIDLKDNNKNNFEFGKKQETKLPLYHRCINHINEFTKNNVDNTVKNLLITFLDSLVEMKKLRGETQFVGILKKLKEYGSTEKQQIKIIQNSIEHGYGTFYELNEYKKINNYASSDMGRVGKRMTAEQKKQFKEDIASGKAEKF